MDRVQEIARLFRCSTSTVTVELASPDGEPDLRKEFEAARDERSFAKLLEVIKKAPRGTHLRIDAVEAACPLATTLGECVALREAIDRQSIQRNAVTKRAYSLLENK
jgi:hypothetical protein